MSLVKIKDINALIDNKPFFDQPVKYKQEAYKKIMEISGNNDYTTRNLLDFSYHKYYYKLIGIDLSRQTNMSISQRINFVEKLEEDDGATMFLLLKRFKNYSKLFFRFIN